MVAEIYVSCEYAAYSMNIDSVSRVATWFDSITIPVNYTLFPRVASLRPATMAPVELAWNICVNKLCSICLKVVLPCRLSSSKLRQYYLNLNVYPVLL